MSPGGAATLTVLGVAAGSIALRSGARPASRVVGLPGAAVTGWVPPAVLACVEVLGLRLEPAATAQWFAGAMAAPLLLLAIAGPTLALGAAAALLLAPRLLLPTLRRRRAAQRDAQLAPFLERVASTIRSGRSVRVAVVATARAAEPPLLADLTPLADALDHGAALEDALAHWSAAPGASGEVRLAAAALQLGARAGGEVARAVDGVAATLRERREVQGEVVALATQARMSAGLLVVAPLGFAALVSTIEPGAVQFLVSEPIGWACLAGGLGLDALGAAWMQRIVRNQA